MSKFGSWAFIGSRVLALAGLMLSGAAVAAAYDPGHWNMPRGVTEISREVFGLHMLIFWVCVGIGILVFGVMFYSVFAHRRSRHPKPADFHESTTVEIIWTIVPFVILILMAIPAAGTLIKMEDSTKSDLSVKVTGFQWKWEYDYLQEGIHFFSNISTPRDQIDNKVAKDPHYLLEVDHPLVVHRQKNSYAGYCR